MRSVHLLQRDGQPRTSSENARFLGSGLQGRVWNLLAGRDTKLFVQSSRVLDGLFNPMRMFWHGFAFTIQLA